MSYRGAELRLPSAGITISSDALAFPPEFGYGPNEDFLKVFVFSYVKFLCDSPLEHDSPRDKKCYMRFLTKLVKHPLRDTIKMFSSLANSILSNEYSTGSDSSTRIFVPDIMHTPVFREYHEWIKTGRPELLKYVLSFLAFGKKLDYVDSELDATAFRGWLEVEDRLDTLEFGSNDVESLTNIVAALLPPLSPTELIPRFGPGRVSEKGVSTVYDKLSCLAHDRRLEYVFYRSRPFADWDRGFSLARAITRGTYSDNISTLKFVPKDITKSRSICMEPNGYMYFQQEVLRWMRNAMDRGLISRFVNLDDQTPNQYAAVHGSKYLSSDTIDLSSASDSVHADLVRRIFPKDWLFYMFGSRTSKVWLPDGSIKQVKKFAPMGSAICFPTQCIIFTAISLYAYISRDRGFATGESPVTREEAIEFILTRLHKERGAGTPFTRKYEPPVVFGDDIICDSRVTDEVISTLFRLGFQVNVNKSFTGSQSFRESCGVFAYEGDDVTPVMFRASRFKRGKWDAKVYASLLGSINNFGDHGYHSVATFLRSVVHGYGFHYPVPYTKDRLEFGIYTSNKRKPDPNALRWNADWQVYEELQQGITNRTVGQTRPPNLDDYMYNQWWRSRVGGKATSLSERSLLIRPQETRLAPKWARCEL